MPRAASVEVRRALVERAAEMLVAREAVTLRTLVDSVGTSTMAVYTHFGGMSGLWRAVRQEGFIRLSHRLAAVPVSDDPVGDLMALGAAYASNALANPHLYRAMFDTAADLDDPEVAGASFGRLVEAAERARQAGRFAASSEPEAVATRLWAAGHGLVLLIITGVLPAEVLPVHATASAEALFVAAGDDRDRCRRSVNLGWEQSYSP